MEKSAKKDAGTSQQNAQRHLLILQEAVAAFFDFEKGIDGTLKAALKSLLDDLSFDSAFVFLYDAPSNSLECAQARMRQRGIIAGESRIPIVDKEDDLISLVFLGKRSYAIWDDGLQIAVGLREGDDRIGVLIADKLVSKNKISAEEKELLGDYAREFSRGIKHIKIFQANLRKIEMLLALSKISEAMVSVMELQPVLSIILNSAVEILKFDRAKLYLVDNQNKLLQGQISADIRKVIKPIEMESYPLQPGINRTVDTLFGQDGNYMSNSDTEKLFLYVPLVIKQAKIGVLMVDNVFSRQPITQEDRENFDILANQAAVTIEKARLYNEIKELSVRDSLTGLYVHRYFLERLDDEVKRASRAKEHLSLMLMDIDSFKSYNDIYGHQTGDRLLEALSDILKQKVRGVDLKGRASETIGRYGGDEFVVVLPETDINGAVAIATRIQEEVRSKRIMAQERETAFTVSIGIAAFPEDGDSADELFKKADKALYLAKSLGKDQIFLAENIGKERPNLKRPV